MTISAPSPANMDMMTQVAAVLSVPRNENGSEDVKSALIELIKLARTGSRQNVTEIKNLVPVVTDTLKHPEVFMQSFSDVVLYFSSSNASAKHHLFDPNKIE